MEFWNAAAATTVGPLALDEFLDCCALICGDESPELREKFRGRAVEARADAFIRTLDGIRDL